jgi:nucleoid-associated protein YgaU
MSTHYNDSAANVKALADAIPGLSGVVARAWLHCEGQATANPTNPLNILYYPTELQTGKSGRFGTYKSAHDGIADAARIIHTLSYYQGVRAVLGQSPLIVAHAIEASPWAGGHYGAAKGRDGCISRAVRKAQSPAPAKPVLRYVVQPGDSLSGIAGKLWHDTSLWTTIYSKNRALIGDNPNLIHPGQVLVIPPKPKG